MKVSAILNKQRIAPRKVRLTTDLIKGLDVAQAIAQLDATVKGSALSIKKLLLSAISNGENNFGIDRDNMYVQEVKVEAGPVLKRWMPKAYGRAGRILKRTAKIEIVLEERVPGKGRKSKEEMEKEKQKRMEAKKKEEKKYKERQKKEQEQEEKEDAKKGESGFAKTTENKEIKNPPAGGEKKGGLTSKIFRRKSM